MEAFYLMTRLASTPANLALGRADLTHALKIVARGIGKHAGEASLRFENGLLSVEAHGTVASAPASGAWPIHFCARFLGPTAGAENAFGRPSPFADKRRPDLLGAVFRAVRRDADSDSA